MARQKNLQGGLPKSSSLRNLINGSARQSRAVSVASNKDGNKRLKALIGELNALTTDDTKSREEKEKIAFDIVKEICANPFDTGRQSFVPLFCDTETGVSILHTIVAHNWVKAAEHVVCHMPELLSIVDNNMRYPVTIAIDIQNEDLLTVLIMGQTKLINNILASGINILSLACEQEWIEGADIIASEYPALLTATMKDTITTPLIVAVDKGNATLVRLLLTKGPVFLQDTTRHARDRYRSLQVQGKAVEVEAKNIQVMSGIICDNLPEIVLDEYAAMPADCRSLFDTDGKIALIQEQLLAHTQELLLLAAYLQEHGKDQAIKALAKKIEKQVKYIVRLENKTTDFMTTKMQAGHVFTLLQVNESFIEMAKKGECAYMQLVSGDLNTPLYKVEKGVEPITVQDIVVDITDEDGFTPLKGAVLAGNYVLTEVLLLAGTIPIAMESSKPLGHVSAEEQFCFSFVNLCEQITRTYDRDAICQLAAKGIFNAILARQNEVPYRESEAVEGEVNDVFIVMRLSEKEQFINALVAYLTPIIAQIPVGPRMSREDVCAIIESIIDVSDRIIAAQILAKTSVDTQGTRPSRTVQNKARISYLDEETITDFRGIGVTHLLGLQLERVGDLSDLTDNLPRLLAEVENTKKREASPTPAVHDQAFEKTTMQQAGALTDVAASCNPGRYVRKVSVQVTLTRRLQRRATIVSVNKSLKDPANNQPAQICPQPLSESMPVGNLLQQTKNESDIVAAQNMDEGSHSAVPVPKRNIRRNLGRGYRASVHHIAIDKDALTAPNKENASVSVIHKENVAHKEQPVPVDQDRVEGAQAPLSSHAALFAHRSSMTRRDSIRRRPTRRPSEQIIEEHNENASKMQRHPTCVKSHEAEGTEQNQHSTTSQNITHTGTFLARRDSIRSRPQSQHTQETEATIVNVSTTGNTAKKPPPLLPKPKRSSLCSVNTADKQLLTMQERVQSDQQSEGRGCG